MTSTILFQTQSLCILFLLGIGIYFRTKRKIHIRIMSVAITWDILLILQIEFFRDAIFKASKALSNPFILNLHVSLAVMTVFFYFALVCTGRRVLLNHPNIKKIHKKLGIGAVLLRIFTFITSLFSVESGQNF